MKNKYDWKNNAHKSWPYSPDAPENKKWQRDRKITFVANGNEWWWGQGETEKQKVNRERVEKDGKI